ncbi:MAG TPA: hypothetical protein VGH28_13860 [Polyangiaceae bacterium]|jgi:hypothetical protein
MLALTLDDADFLHDADRGLDTLEHATDRAAHNAGDEGVRAEQADHPYQDRTQNLTGGAHVEPTGDGTPGVDMVWPADYASFVNNGTERAKPYPFAPIAEERADQVLHYDLANAVDAFTDDVSK